MIHTLTLLTLLAAPAGGLQPKNRPYDVQHYKIELRQGEGATFNNVVSITVKASKALPEIEFDAYDLKFTSAKIDGEAADFNASIPPDFDEIVFVNVTPYARKIEKGLSDQAPDGVYEAVAALAARRFGNIVKVRFSFRSPNFGGINSWAAKAGAGGRGSRGANAEARLRRQPAIVLTRG
jgi:hypothetical protein